LAYEVFIGDGLLRLIFALAKQVSVYELMRGVYLHIDEELVRL